METLENLEGGLVFVVISILQFVYCPMVYRVSGWSMKIKAIVIVAVLFVLPWPFLSTAWAVVSALIGVCLLLWGWLRKGFRAVEKDWHEHGYHD